MNKTFLPYSRQCIDKEDIKSVSEVLESDFITQGPKLQEFQKALCELTNAKHAQPVNSGTAALNAACFALGIEKGDEVLVPNNTFVSTANGVELCGGNIVPIDNEANSFHMDLDLVEKNITEKTVGIIPMHYGGMPCNLKRLSEIAKKNNLWIIEDATHALGANYYGEPIGDCKYSDGAIFSFHPVKMICTGEGGAFVTNNTEIFEKVKQYSSIGITKDITKYETPELNNPWNCEMHFVGQNYRMDELQAALGVSQLKKIDYFVKKRREIISKYVEYFKPYSKIMLPLTPKSDDQIASYHLFPILFDFVSNGIDKAQAMNELRDKKIGTQVHYQPISHHPYYRKKYHFAKNDFPNTEDVFNRSLSIPVFPQMNDEDIKYVVDSLICILKLDK